MQKVCTEGRADIQVFQEGTESSWLPVDFPTRRTQPFKGNLNTHVCARYCHSNLHYYISSALSIALFSALRGIHFSLLFSNNSLI